MEKIGNNNEITRIVIDGGVCSFQNFKKAVLQLNGQTRTSRPQAQMSPEFANMLGAQLASHLRVTVTTEVTGRGYVFHLSHQPTAEALRHAPRVEISHPNIAQHANRQALEIVEWILRTLFNVPFTMTLTSDLATLVPPRPPARYSTPPLRKITKDPEQPASSKRKK